MVAFLVKHRELVLLTCIAALPVLVAFARAVAHGWWPEGDDAVLGLKVADVFSSNPPTMGMRSTAGNADPMLASHHPGPMAIYLLAIPTGLAGLHPIGLLVGAAAIHIALIVGTCIVAHRRGGPRLALMSLIAVLAIQWAVGAEALFRPLNPYPASLGVLLLLLLAWSLLVGDTPCSWGFVATASLIAQANLAFLPLVAGLSFMVVITALRRWHRSGRRRPRWLWPAIARRDSRHSRRTIIALVLCWLPVLVETLRFKDSNVLQILRYVTSDADKDPLGWSAMIGAFLPQLVPLPGGFSAGDALFEDRIDVMVVLGGLVVVTLAVLATPFATVRWPAWRQESRTWALVALIALILVGWSGASAPTSLVGVAWYWLLPIWPCAVFAWLVIVSAVLDTRRPHRSGSQQPVKYAVRRTSQPKTGGRKAVVLAMILLAVIAVRSPVPLTWRDLAGKQASAIVLEGVRGLAPAPHPIQVTSGGGWTAWASVLPAVSYRLRSEGYPVYSVSHWPLPEDVTFRAAENAPVDSVQIHVVERDANGSWQGSPEGDGWRLIGTIEGRPEAGQAEVAIHMRFVSG